MSKAGKRLGRGLDSLVSNILTKETLDSSEVLVSKKARELTGPSDQPALIARGALGARTVPVHLLSANPFQPRGDRSLDELDSLKESIARHGVLQPIIVREFDGRFEIVAGERRWRSAVAVGLKEVPVVRIEADDERMLELALIENIQREDLNAIERANAYREFSERFHLKPEEIASRMGEDRTTVVNYLRLLDLSPPIQGMVASGQLSMGHARCLLGIADPAHRAQLAESAVRSGLSVRALEEIVRRDRMAGAGAGAGPALRQPPAPPPNVTDMQRRFERAVKTKVIIREGRKKGTGRIILEYYSLDDFERIAALLGVEKE